MVMTPPPMADYLVVAPLVIGFVFGALCLMTRKNTGRQPFIAITGHEHQARGANHGVNSVKLCRMRDQNIDDIAMRNESPMTCQH